MTIGEVIKEYREEHHISQRQFAKLSGQSNGYISMLEKGENPKNGKPIQPSLAVIKEIAAAMGMPLTELLTKAEDLEVDLSGNAIPVRDEEKGGIVYRNLFPVSRRRFPLLGEIACGKPIYAEEDHESYVDASSTIEADFCLRAKGDSMTGARIYDGDIVFIKEAPMVENGRIAAVIIGDEATLKRVFYYPEQNQLMLLSENPKYPPQIYIGEELNAVRILGRAVALQTQVL